MKFTPEIYAIKDEPMKSFIDPIEIEDMLQTIVAEPSEVRKIIAKSISKKRLSMQEVAVLLNTSDPALIEEIKAGARQLKKNVYGERIVLFAPLYVGNYCINNCKYCGFKASNKDAKRKTLGREELIQNVEALENEGQKRLILVYGEHPQYSPEFIANSVKTVYGVKKGNGEIRRVNINAAPLDIDGFKTVKKPESEPTRSFRKPITQRPTHGIIKVAAKKTLTIDCNHSTVPRKQDWMMWVSVLCSAFTTGNLRSWL